MNDSAFDAALDRLVIGRLPADRDDLTDFVGELYRKEQTVMMPTTLKQQVAQTLGIAPAAPVSNRTRRAQAMTPARQRPRWGAMFAITMAALLALTGIFQLGSNSNRDDSRFGVLSPAVPTAEATPSAADAEAWLYPIDAHECPLDETEIVNQENNPSATWYTMDEYAAVKEQPLYVPISVAEPADANAVTLRLRQQDACALVGNRMLTKFWTVRWEFENRTTAGREFAAADKLHRDAARHSIAAFYESEMGLTPNDMLIMLDASTYGVTDDGSRTMHTRYNPAQAIELGDGRIALISSNVMYRDGGEGDVSGEPVAYPFVMIFAFVDGEWRLDETMQICLGDCEAYWESESATPVD